MKKKYLIDGFNCPHCAIKTEEFLNKDSNIKGCSINFTAGIMTIEYEKEEYNVEIIQKMIRDFIHENVVVQAEKENHSYKVKILNNEIISLIVRCIISIIFLIASVIIEHTLQLTKFVDLWWLMFGLYMISYFVIAYDILWLLVKSFKTPKNFFGESTLMVIASIGAILISLISDKNNFLEAIMVVLLGQIGEILEEISTNRSKNAIIDAIDMRAKTSSLVVNEEIKNVDTKSLKRNDIVILKVGETVPSDGTIISGDGEFDTSSITGEFMPINATVNDSIVSGYILKSGLVKLIIDKDYKDSTTSKILDLVMESGEHKSKAERFITRFAKVYTPLMFALAVLVAFIPSLVMGFTTNDWSWNNTWYRWVYYALTLLVIACPCAVLISVPLTYFTGVGLASKYGLVVKGANYLERINDIKEVVMDKTGTLTKGNFSIVKEEFNNVSKEEFESIIALLESQSTHPIAKALSANFKNSLNLSIKTYKEIPGQGIKAIVGEYVYLIGNSLFLKNNGIEVTDIINGDTTIYLGRNKQFIGYVSLEDTEKENSKLFINSLKNRNIKTLMLTGGKKESAEYTCSLLGIDRYKSNLLPDDKIKYLKEEIDNKTNKKYAIAYIGDGINDAPCIILSDVGFAMGALGSDASIANADIVIMNDDPIKVIEAFEIAKKTKRRAITCIVVALLVKLTVMILSLPQINLVNMWIAVLVDSGLSVILIIFAILLIKTKIRIK